MRKLLLIFLVLFLLPGRANAMEFQAPPVPSGGEAFMPENTESFMDGLISILKDAVKTIKPAITDGIGICLCAVICCVLCAMVKAFPGSQDKVTELVSSLLIGCLLLRPSNALIRLGTDTIVQLCNYGKLLFPVLSAALAANGGFSRSTALYTGAVALNTALSGSISSVIVPTVYAFLCICVASAATGNEMLEKLKGYVQGFITWAMKTVLYVFTGFMGITGIISGTADASAVKATKLTFSGMVPVVGGLLADASETVLISAGIIKNAIGAYGLLAVVSIWIGPFIEIGVQYLLLKATYAVCAVFTAKESGKLLGDFTSAMGMILGMTGTVCLLLLISIVCFMKGAAV